MTILTSTTPSFVRCIKPNTLQAKNNFDDPVVVEQLSYLGMLETIRYDARQMCHLLSLLIARTSLSSSFIRIRRMGYAMRYTFAEFLKRFAVLSIQPIKEKDAAKACVLLLDQLRLTKVRSEKKFKLCDAQIGIFTGFSLVKL